MSDRSTTRRRLLLYTLAGGTAAASGVLGFDKWREARAANVASKIPDRPGFLAPDGKIARRRRLGRTGLDVSVVGIGAGGLESTAPIHRAVDKGINYLDTSCCYGHGGSENVIGRAFKESPALRDKIVLATKWDAGAHMPKSRILASLDESLQRMGTDRIDVMQIHQLGDHLPNDDGFSRLDNPELYEAMADAKRSGKVRFFGATGHTGNRTAILSHAIDKGAFDVILVKMNVLDFEGANVDALLAHAKAKDVGVVVMKSQPNGGMIPKGFEQSKWSIYQANLRWVLEHDVACVVHSAIGTDERVQDLAIGAAYDELKPASPQQTHGAIDRDLHEAYARALSPHYCRGCADAACTKSCREVGAHVAIPIVLRAVMYEREYGWRDQAQATYDALAQDGDESLRWSDRCLSCNACTDACPFGVDAADRVRSARARLGPFRV